VYFTHPERTLAMIVLICALVLLVTWPGSRD
jgi:hypothetical protein